MSRKHSRASRYSVDSQGDAALPRRRSTHTRRLSQMQMVDLKTVLLDRVKPYFESKDWRLYSPTATDSDGVRRNWSCCC